MKILKATIPVLFVFILGGCSDSSEKAIGNNGDSLTVDEEAAPPQVEIVFPELFRHFSKTDSSFSTDGFEGGQTDVRVDSNDQSITNETIAKYMPFLMFNADSTYAIDMVTNNYVTVERNDKIVLEEGGPDFEVGLIDLRNNKRKQLLFFGTMGTVLDASWLDNNTVVIAGANEVQGDSIRPVIWKYEIPTNAWFVYTYDKMIANDAGGYPRKWIQDPLKQSEPSPLFE